MLDADPMCPPGLRARHRLVALGRELDKLETIDDGLSKVLLGRFGKVEEVAALVAWLASRECSFSTGAAFDISGGRATY